MKTPENSKVPQRTLKNSKETKKASKNPTECVNGFFPVYIGVTYRQLMAVTPKNLKKIGIF